ncbi:17756_t:CDS:2 [Rhizophagus irregularis]|nr:17756_t:CDS:2 [Rhizophagus irregularis]
MKISANFEIWLNLMRIGQLANYKKSLTMCKERKKFMKEVKLDIVKAYFSEVDENLKDFIADDDKIHVNYKSEGYNYGNPSFDNEDYNRNNDKPSLDNKDYDEEDNKGDIEIKSNCSKTSEISSYISKENDELMDDNKKFEKSEITKMSNGTVNIMLLIVILIE